MIWRYNQRVEIEFESGRKIADPSVEDLINHIPYEVFSILSKQPEEYMQCSQGDERSGEFTLEVREGSVDRHFRAVGDQPLSIVLWAFQKYLEEDLSWKEELQWELLSSEEAVTALGWIGRLFSTWKGSSDKP